MCGLVGAFKPAGDCSSDKLITAMRDRMVHRGPDGGDNWRSKDGTCAFGHRRLSIIDLSTAASQPMLNERGDVAVIFNGEIYNHAEVRRELEALGKYRWQTDHSDTEVLLHAFEEWGLACFDKFYGMWGVAIYDGRKPGRPVVHLIRDRVGIKPVYFTRTGTGEWLFASEIRALLAHPQVPAEMDPTAFWHYLTFIVAPAPLTMFRGVFKLPPATTVTIDHTGRAVARRYWDCKPSAKRLLRAGPQLRGGRRRNLAAAAPVHQAAHGLGRAVRRAAVGRRRQQPQRRPDERTHGPAGHDVYGRLRHHEEFNEFDHARRIAKRYGTDHHETRISSQEALDFLPLLVELQDEPIADNVCIPLYFLSRLVRQSGTTVVQVGEGADENFLGYWWCDHYRKKESRSTTRPATAARSWFRRASRQADSR